MATGGLYVWGWILVIAQVLGVGSEGGAEAGRRGNALFQQGQYAEAVAAYQRGLRATADTTGAVYAALQHNLGAALHRQEEYARARRSFRRAVRAAVDPEERERALYNAGNASAGMGELRAALGYYRQALRVAPSSERARYNYEYVKRKLARQQSGSSRRRQDVEPSSYARQLKKKAEALVAERKYQAALDLMEKGQRRDSTVAAYRQFIGRIRDVARIDAGASGGGPGQTMQSRPPGTGAPSPSPNRSPLPNR
jgi:tetratricopeptide (TPR) repeat protein